jgi:hypothetical protein
MATIRSRFLEKEFVFIMHTLEDNNDNTGTGGKTVEFLNDLVDQVAGQPPAETISTILGATMASLLVS